VVAGLNPLCPSCAKRQKSEDEPGIEQEPCAEPVERSEDTGDKRLNEVRMFGPDRYVTRLAVVSVEDLYNQGFRGLIVDLDNTLMGFHQTELEADHLEWVARAHERGFRIVMVSNNFTARVSGIASQLGVDSISNALKPLPFAVMRAMRMLAMPRRQIAMVGDQLFTDVLCGKICGMYTILTEPIENKDFALTKVFRFFERLMLPERPTE
jgi:uncharacterized protein